MSARERSASHVPVAFLGVLWLILAAAIGYLQVRGANQIEVSWSTESEFETAGFNIFRSTEREGDYNQINEQLVPAEGNAARGADYTYLDSDIQAGQTYYYRLEEIEFDNSRQMYDIDVFDGGSANTGMVALAGLSALVGLFLIVTAIRENRKQ